MCLKRYELDPAHFLTVLSGLVWEAALKRTEIRLDVLTDIDKLLMVEKGIRRGICHAIPRYEASNKHNESYKKNEELLYLKYWYVNNLH